MEFDVIVWGWFPENEHKFGGSPEMDDVITVTAANPKEAVVKARAQFKDEHGFDVVMAELEE